MPTNLWTRIRHDLTSPTALICCVVATVILGVIGPFGMYETTPLPQRLIYWAIVIALATVLALTLKHLSQDALRRRGYFVVQIAAGLGFSVIFTPTLYALNAVFLAERWESLMPWTLMLGFVFAVFVSIGMVIETVQRQLHVTDEPVADVALEPHEDCAAGRSVKFLERLDPRYRTCLVRLAMQDHYVEMHSLKGTQLILMRLSDAIAELNGLDGLQVHRSHWVALDAVRGTERDGAKLFLITSDGGRVPVSRSYKDAVRDAGLI